MLSFFTMPMSDLSDEMIHSTECEMRIRMYF